LLGTVTSIKSGEVFLHIIACPFLFFFFLTIALSVLQFTASDYHFVRDRDSMLVIMIEKYLLIDRQCNGQKEKEKKRTSNNVQKNTSI
jgi:hypothetical protein